VLVMLTAGQELAAACTLLVTHPFEIYGVISPLLHFSAVRERHCLFSPHSSYVMSDCKGKRLVLPDLSRLLVTQSLTGAGGNFAQEVIGAGKGIITSECLCIEMVLTDRAAGTVKMDFVFMSRCIVFYYTGLQFINAVFPQNMEKFSWVVVFSYTDPGCTFHLPPSIIGITCLYTFGGAG